MLHPLDDSGLTHRPVPIAQLNQHCVQNLEALVANGGRPPAFTGVSLEDPAPRPRRVDPGPGLSLPGDESKARRPRSWAAWLGLRPRATVRQAGARAQFPWEADPDDKWRARKWLVRQPRLAFACAALLVVGALVAGTSAVLSLVVGAATTKLAGPLNTVVQNVVEPEQPIASASGAAWVLEAWAGDPPPAQVARGYLAWDPPGLPARANFTLDHALEVLRRDCAAADCTCTCYLLFGLPWNAVYVAPPLDTVLYGPALVEEDGASPLVEVQHECALHALLGRPHAAHAVQTRSVGTLAYTEHGTGTRQRAKLTLPLYPCVKHCLSLVDSAATSVQ